MSSTTIAPARPAFDAPLSPAELLAITRELAQDHEQWRALAQHTPHERWFTRLAAHADHDVWLIGWDSYQGVDLHDHGGSSGALYVVDGELLETATRREGRVRPGAAPPRRHRAGVRPGPRPSRREPVGRPGHERARLLAAAGGDGLLLCAAAARSSRRTRNLPSALAPGRGELR